MLNNNMVKNEDIGESGMKKNCPQCGYQTIRDFCTPQCRMEDSDNRIEGVEDERDRYKKALELIIKSEECKVCKCQQVIGKTYDGLNFIHLQKMAKEAVDHG